MPLARNKPFPLIYPFPTSSSLSSVPLTRGGEIRVRISLDVEGLAGWKDVRNALFLIPSKRGRKLGSLGSKRRKSWKRIYPVSRFRSLREKPHFAFEERKKSSLSLSGVNTHLFPGFVISFIGDDPVNLGKKGVIFT